MRLRSILTRQPRDARYGHLALAIAMLVILVLGVTRMQPQQGRGAPVRRASHDDPPAARRQAPLTAPVYTSTDNLTASMNGHVLRIPRFYLLSDPEYADAGSRPAPRALRSFAIRLRLSDFEPVRTPKDEADWSASVAGEASLYETFTTVGVYAMASPSNNPLQWTLADIEADAGPPGTFQLQPERVAGLSHAVTDAAADFSTNEVFYDSEGWRAVIPCHSFRQPPSVQAPTVSACQLQFPLPELGALAVADLTKKDLGRWQEIEAAVGRLTHAFAEHEH